MADWAKEQYSGGSLRIVSGLAENTNSIICDGSREPETANGCLVLHRMRGPSAVRHSCAPMNPDQPKARSPERARRPCIFFLTLTYMDVGNPPTEIEIASASAQGSNGRYTSKWRCQCGRLMLADFPGVISYKPVSGP